MASTAADFLAPIQARLQDNILSALTNDDAALNPTQPAVDTTVLTYAIDDAIGMFEFRAGRSPVHTNRTDLAIMVKGVIVALATYKPGLVGVDYAMYERRFTFECQDLRNQMTPGPVTNNETTETDRTNGGTSTVYKDSDRRFFSDYLPRANRRSSRDYRTDW